MIGWGVRSVDADKEWMRDGKPKVGRSGTLLLTQLWHRGCERESAGGARSRTACRAVVIVAGL